MTAHEKREITVTRLEELRQQIREADYAYHVMDNPAMADADYDKLFRELTNLEKSNPALADPNSPTARVGGLHVTGGFQKVKHITRMLSIENAFSAQEVLAWAGKGTAVTVEPKIDGLSMEARYVNGQLVQAVTRGDGHTGEDVTANARTIQTLPLVLKQPVTINVRGEVYMRFSQFTRLNQRLEENGEELLANPRNAASGGLKRKNPAETAARGLSFVAYGTPDLLDSLSEQYMLYEFLEDLGFRTVLTLPQIGAQKTTVTAADLDSEADADRLIEKFAEFRAQLDLPTDGLVFKLSRRRAQQELGEKTRTVAWAVAFKFPPERVMTKLNQIFVTVGKTGKITPMADLEPVKVSGTTVSRASLMNEDELVRIGNPAPGDTVTVEKSAEIIPRVVSVVYRAYTDLNTKKRGNLAEHGILTEAQLRATKLEDQKAIAKQHGLKRRPWRLPETCPSCKSELVRPEGFVDRFCYNRKCREQVTARLLFAVSRPALNIDGCGRSTINELVALGVSDLLDFFTIPAERLTFKKAALKKFLAGRENAKKADMGRKLAALCVEGWGVETCNNVAAIWPDIPAMHADSARFKSEVGEKRFEAWKAFIKREADYLDALEEAGFVFENTALADGPLTGKVFVITGAMPSGISRNDLSEIIKKHGGVVKGSVSKKVQYLIVGDDAGGTKTEAAEKRGTKLLTEPEFFAMIGKPVPTMDEAPVHPEQNL